VAFGWLASPSTINADNRARAVDFGVFRHRLALLVVLVFGVGASTKWADYCVLRTRASCRFMAEHPATVALRDEGAGLILSWTGGAVTK